MGLKDGIHTEDLATISLACASCGRAVPTGQSHQCNENVTKETLEWQKEEKEHTK